MSRIMRQLAAEGRAAREAAERAKAEAKHPLYEVKVDPAAPLQGQERTGIWVDELSELPPVDPAAPLQGQERTGIWVDELSELPPVDPLKPCEHGKYYYCTKCGGYRGSKP